MLYGRGKHATCVMFLFSPPSILSETNGAHLYSAVVLAWTQILNGLDGGISVVCVKVMVQASVPHEDMGIVISNLALWTKLFGAISTALGE